MQRTLLHESGIMDAALSSAEAIRDHYTIAVKADRIPGGISTPLLWLSHPIISYTPRPNLKKQ